MQGVIFLFLTRAKEEEMDKDKYIVNQEGVVFNNYDFEIVCRIKTTRTAIKNQDKIFVS